MPTKLRVRLSDDERVELDRLVRCGVHHARRIQHARILLLADDGPADRSACDAGYEPAWTDEKVADALGCSHLTVARTRTRYVREGLEAALRVRKPSPGRPPKIDEAAEAHLVALACSEPPPGRATWSLRLLADRFCALGAESGWLGGTVSHETVRQALKKTSAAPTAYGGG